MKLSAPRKNTFIIAIVLGALGLLGMFAAIPFVSANAFWVLAAGFVLLVLANLFKI